MSGTAPNTIVNSSTSVVTFDGKSANVLKVDFPNLNKVDKTRTSAPGSGPITYRAEDDYECGEFTIEAQYNPSLHDGFVADTHTEKTATWVAHLGSTTAVTFTWAKAVLADVSFSGVVDEKGLVTVKLSGWFNCLPAITYPGGV